jgi:hypothetical protein
MQSASFVPRWTAHVGAICNITLVIAMSEATRQSI